MRKLLIAVGILAGVLVLAAIIVPMLVPTSVYRDKLIAKVKESTGHDLRIDGPVSISVLGGLGLKAQTVSLSGAPGDPTPLASLASLQVGVKLIPLLSGVVDITGITLDSPTINLRVGRDGTPNWAMHPEGKPASAAGPAETRQAASPLNQLQRLRLGAVTIHSGTVTYADARKPGTQTMNKLEADLRWPSFADKLNLTGSLAWKGETVKFAVDTGSPDQFMQLKPLPVTIELDAPALNLAFTGEVEPGAPAVLDGGVSASTSSVGKLGGWLGTPLPGPQDASGEMKAHLRHQGPVTAFNGFSAALGQASVAGDLAFTSGGPRPLLKGTLRFSELDLDPYLPAAGAARNGEPAGQAKLGEAPQPSATPAGWSTAPLDFQPLLQADADLSVQTAGLRYRAIAIGATEINLMLHDGLLNTVLKRMSLYGGAGSGTVTLRAGAVPQLGMQFALQGVAMQPLLKAAIGLDRVSGTGTLNVAVSGTGRSQREMIGGLAGSGNFRVVNGAVSGFDLPNLVHSLASAAGERNAGGQTTFSDMSGSFTIAEGLLHNGDLALASPLVHASGAGDVSLPARTVNYRIDATLLPSAGTVAPGGANGVELPVLVTGPWDNLGYKPDLTALLHQKLDTKQLLNSAKGFLKGQPATTTGRERHGATREEPKGGRRAEGTTRRSLTVQTGSAKPAEAS